MTSSHEAHIALEKIVSQEIDTAAFPTHFNISIRLKELFADENVSMKKIASVLASDASISAKIVQIANSAAFYGKGEVRDLERAVLRLGVPSVRRIALGIIMVQLQHSKDLVSFASLSRKIWVNSVYSGSVSSVLAKEFTQIHPYEAFFASFVANIGAYYLLFKASKNPLLKNSADDVEDALIEHTFSLSVRVLRFLGFSDESLTVYNKLDDFEWVDNMRRMDDLVRNGVYLGEYARAWRNNSELEEPEEYKQFEGEFSAEFSKNLAEMK